MGLGTARQGVESEEDVSRKKGKKGTTQDQQEHGSFLSAVFCRICHEKSLFISLGEVTRQECMNVLHQQIDGHIVVAAARNDNVRKFFCLAVPTPPKRQNPIAI